jgi:PAS domain S-box-containing protein
MVEVGYTPEQIDELRGRLVPGVPLRRDGLHRRKDGTVFPVEVNLARFDWDGKPVTLGVARDISERQRAQEALRESEQWYQTLAAVSPVGIFRTDRAGAFVYVNDRWTRMAGLPAEQARGDGWARVINPEDRERVVAGWVEAAREGKPFEIEYRFLSPQGEATWVLGSARAVKGQGGEVVGYVGTVTDITERRRSEEDVKAARDELERRVAERTAELEEANENLRREVKERARYEEALRYSEEKYSTLVEHSPTGVFIFRGGKFVFANPQLAAMGGYSREEFLAMDPFDLVHPEDRDWVRDMASRRLAGESVPTDYEVRVVTRAGETRWVNVRNALITYRGGPSTLATVQDVTERKRMEEALARSGNELRRLSAQILSAQEEERARIARDLHDGIGQALSAIKFQVESAVPTCERLAGEAQMQTLRAAVARVQQTIEEVRRISMDLRPSILDDLGLVTTLGWVCREFSGRNPQIEVVRRVEVAEADVPEPLRIVVFRIVQEALQNVAKHSGANRVELGLRRAGDDLELWVRDDGRGFDPEALAHRVGEARGFGIGSMRERAQASGGGIEVVVPPGGGTTIRVRWALAGDRRPRASG